MERELGSDRIVIIGGERDGEEGTITRRWSAEEGSFIEVAMDSGDRLIIQSTRPTSQRVQRETGS